MPYENQSSRICKPVQYVLFSHLRPGYFRTIVRIRFNKHN
jgi:hypothetical protein